MVKRISKRRNGAAGATMEEIARRVGVSQATVSYVLNAKPNARVSPETRRRVLDVAALLQYRPNAIASAMATGRSGTIGVYQPHAPGAPLSGMWTETVTRGIGESLHERQLHLLLYGYRATEDPPPSAFLDGRVDGLIILAPHVEDALPGQLSKSDLPVVVVGGPNPGGERSGFVDADNAAGAALVVEHLIRLGRSRIAHLRGPAGVPNAVDRLAGFERALRNHGLRAESNLVVESGFSERGGHAAARAVLTRAPRPSAIFAANDVAALGALRACEELGLSVPEDVAVVGFDDSSVCELARPRLTSVRQPAFEMGRAAAEILLALIDGESTTRCRVLTPELVVRESCGARAGNPGFVCQRVIAEQ